ncbi:competence type IV pilus minor pilin ComGF [Dellaglioa sp. BT-FLS60]
MMTCWKLCANQCQENTGNSEFSLQQCIGLLESDQLNLKIIDVGKYTISMKNDKTGARYYLSQHDEMIQFVGFSGGHVPILYHVKSFSIEYDEPILFLKIKQERQNRTLKLVIPMEKKDQNAQK